MKKCPLCDRELMDNGRNTYHCSTQDSRPGKNISHYQVGSSAITLNLFPYQAYLWYNETGQLGTSLYYLSYIGGEEKLRWKHVGELPPFQVYDEKRMREKLALYCLLT